MGVQFAAIPEFQAIGVAVGQQLSAILAGKATVDEALKAGQLAADREMRKGGYYKKAGGPALYAGPSMQEQLTHRRAPPGNVFDIPAPRGQAKWQSHICLRDAE